MNGLTEKEVINNRKKYGTNKITSIKKETFISLFLESLGDPIIRILLIALGIKTVFLIKDFDWYETVGIVISIIIASLISTLSEYGSSKAFEKLQEESSQIKCRVKRNNEEIEIPIDDIVKSDLLILTTGDKIGADGIIVESRLAHIVVPTHSCSTLKRHCGTVIVATLEPALTYVKQRALS